MGIQIKVVDESGLPADTVDALTIVAALNLACDCMRRLGLTKEQAVERAGPAIAAAWDSPQ